MEDKNKEYEYLINELENIQRKRGENDATIQRAKRAIEELDGDMTYKVNKLFMICALSGLCINIEQNVYNMRGNQVAFGHFDTSDLGRIYPWLQFNAFTPHGYRYTGEIMFAYDDGAHGTLHSDMSFLSHRVTIFVKLHSSNHVTTITVLKDLNIDKISDCIAAYLKDYD